MADEPEVVAAVTEDAPVVLPLPASEPTPAPAADRLAEFQQDLSTLELKEIQKKYPDLAKSIVPHISRAVNEAQKGWETKAQERQANVQKAQQWQDQWNALSAEQKAYHLENDPQVAADFQMVKKILGTNGAGQKGTAGADLEARIAELADGVLGKLREKSPDAALEDAQDMFDAIDKVVDALTAKERKAIGEQVEAKVAERLAQLHVDAAEPVHLGASAPSGSAAQRLKAFAEGRAPQDAKWAKEYLDSL